MVKKIMDKLKSKLTGNKDKPPVQIPVEDEEYVVIGEKYKEYDLEEEDEIEEDKTPEIINNKIIEPNFNEIKKPTIEEKVVEVEEQIIEIPEKPEIPKLLVIKINRPEDFNLSKSCIEHEIVLINLENIPIETIAKEFSDFKGYMETMDYKVGKINEYTIIGVKNNINIDKYPLSNMN